MSNKIPPREICWQLERGLILRDACESLEAEFEAGVRKGKAFATAARRLSGRRFESAPARRFKISPNRLRALYGLWKAAGKSDAVFRLRYHRPPTLPSELRLEFFRRALSRPTLLVAYKELIQDLKRGFFVPQLGPLHCWAKRKGPRSYQLPCIEALVAGLSTAERNLVAGIHKQRRVIAAARHEVHCSAGRLRRAEAALTKQLAEARRIADIEEAVI